MADLPEVEMNYQPLYDLIVAPVRCRLLMAGLELKVFDHLQAGKTAAEMAGILKTHEQNTGYLLEGLAMCDLLDKKDGRYQNGPLAGTFLATEQPTYLGPLLQVSEMAWAGALPNLVELVQKGPTARSDMDFHGGEFWAKATKANSAYAKAGSARRMADLVAGLPEFPQMQKMLDLGSGPGIFTIAFVLRHPTMTGVAFDQPPVAEIAQEHIREFGLSDRIEAVGGDFIKDDLGSEYDLVWSSAALNFAKPQIGGLLEKIYQALKPGGMMISFHDGYTHEGTKPDTMLGHLGMLFLGMPDVRFEQGFLAERMLQAGFKSVRSNTLSTPYGPMDLDIARK